jgi:hypothetical protein
VPPREQRHLAYAKRFNVQRVQEVCALGPALHDVHRQDAEAAR